MIHLKGFATVAALALKEAALATVGRIGFKFVFERLLTRLVAVAVAKLIALDSNLFTAEDGQAIIERMKGKRLKVADGEA